MGEFGVKSGSHYIAVLMTYFSVELFQPGGPNQRPIGTSLGTQLPRIWNQKNMQMPFGIMLQDGGFLGPLVSVFANLVPIISVMQSSTCISI